SFLCLFFFYILIVNSTRSHGDLQKGFSAIPGTYLLENLKNVANDGSFPMFRGIVNSLIVSGCSAALCTYFLPFLSLRSRHKQVMKKVVFLHSLSYNPYKEWQYTTEHGRRSGEFISTPHIYMCRHPFKHKQVGL